ncbi:MAG TPA: hypothetical protein VGM76_17750 [Lacipirellulaceae bacterium]
MIPNPIHKVLSTLSTHEVRYLLMGGQACVLYGGAQFSRDCDIVIVCDEQNLERLKNALGKLQAEQIAVPPFAREYLERGHAVHFRCHAAEASEIRLDVMARLRGVAPFEELWSRRTTLEDAPGARLEIVSLPDLVAAKKTQRDKDWPMIRRLIEAHYSEHRDNAGEEELKFWLRESRTPEILIDLAARFPELASREVSDRPLLKGAIAADRVRLEASLAEEESREREVDRKFWEPLKRELEQLRRNRRP